jgi:hypothetical protein
MCLGLISQYSLLLAPFFFEIRTAMMTHQNGYTTCQYTTCQSLAARPPPHTYTSLRPLTGQECRLDDSVSQATRHLNPRARPSTLVGPQQKHLVLRYCCML